jgi:hypothetical protein
MKKIMIMMILMCFSMFGLQLFGSVAMKQGKETGIVSLENKFIKIVISCTGGNVIIFKDKINSVNHAVSSGEDAGLGKLRIFENLNISEFLRSKYKMKIIKNNEDEIILECSYTAQRKNNPWRGFEIIKKYSLKSNENRLLTEWTINAHNKRGTLSPYMHNYLRLREKSYAFAQSQKGLYCENVISKTGGCDQRIILNLKEPWGAIIAPKTKNGVIGYDNSDHTKYIYFWMNEAMPTIEPLFNKMKFAPDSSWKTKYTLAPLRGLKSCHFASADYAAGFTMQNGKSILNFFPLVDMGNVTLKISKENKVINTFSFNAKTGTALTFPVSMGTKLQKLKIEVSTAKGFKKHDIWASPLLVGQEKGSNKMTTKADKKQYAKLFIPREKFFVSPDAVTVSPFFNIVNKLSKKNKRTVKLIIDVPEKVKLLNPIALYGVLHDKITESDISIKGNAYKRYVISKLTFRNIIFVKTTLPPGSKATVFCQIKWNGGEDEVKEIPLESVHIPKAPFPKQLITNIPGFGVIQVYLDAWPDFYKVMRRVGNNTISSSGSWVWKKDEKLKRFYDKARKEGFKTFANFSPFHKAVRGQLYSEDIDKFCAVSLMGKKSKWPCPSYRGKAFQDYVKMIGRLGGLGASMLCLDTEMWSGADYCFCKRCMKRFKEYMGAKHPDLRYIDPHVIRKFPENHPQYIKIWDDFKAGLGCELYRAIAAEFKRTIKQANTPGHYAFLTYSAFSPPTEIYSGFLRGADLLKKEKILTGITPSIYCRGDANKVAEGVRKARAYLGNSEIYTWLSAGGCIPDDEYSAKEFRYCLLENFMNGARGYLILPWYGLDADDLREHAITMCMLVPVEDIIVEGKVMKSIKPSNDNVKICGMEKNEEKLVLLSEYYDKKNTPVSFKLNVTGKCRVVNMLTGKVIANLVKGINTIKTVIPANNRAVLLYIGKRKFDFSKRNDPIFSNELHIEKGANAGSKENKVSAIHAPCGSLVAEKQGGSIVVKNPFYTITFGKFATIEFAKTGKKTKFYYTNLLRAGNMRIYLTIDKNTKREIKYTPGSKEAFLVFSNKTKNEGNDVESKIKLTFFNDSPIIKYEAFIRQKSPLKNYFVSLNKFWFREKAINEMSYYSEGPLRRQGKITDQRGMFAAGDWKNKYRYFCLNDLTNAFGIISRTNLISYVYVSKNQKSGNLSGCDIKSWDTKTLNVSEYIYVGPLGQNAECIAKWAKKLYQ